MPDRFHLDVVRQENETVWFTLVIEEPIRYFVEQYHESTRAFVPSSSHIIEPMNFSQHWVNGRPLIKLVENKLQEIVEASQPRPASPKLAVPLTV